MQNKLPKPITGFRKWHGRQNSLINMPQKWKDALDKGEIFVFYLWIFQRSLRQEITIYY